ncbi:MAG: TlpA family protein disulfide reductase [Candidatus Scalindua sp.]
MIGKPVPDFTLKTLKKDKVNLAEYRNGKKTIIFFWATWCPHCREAMGKLNENSKELIKKDIKLVLINQGEREKIVKNYIQKNNIEFDIFLDEEMSLMEPYGLIGVPTFFFINEEGIVKDVQHILPEKYQDIFSEF